MHFARLAGISVAIAEALSAASTNPETICFYKGSKNSIRPGVPFNCDLALVNLFAGHTGCDGKLQTGLISVGTEASYGDCTALMDPNGFQMKLNTVSSSFHMLNVFSDVYDMFRGLRHMSLHITTLYRSINHVDAQAALVFRLEESS